MSKLPLQPLDIAREALRQLALKRVAPTPDNFRAAYADISGQPVGDFPFETLTSIADHLPRDTPEREQLAARFARAVESGNWDQVREALGATFAALSATRPSWAELLRELMSLLDTPHQNLTRARKLAAVDHVLAANTANPETLFARLSGLVQGWQREPLAERLNHWSDDAADAAKTPATERRRSAEEPADAVAEQPSFAAWLALLLRRGVAPLVGEETALAQEARAIADTIEHDIDPHAADESLGVRLRALEAKLEWAGEDQRAIRASLLNLLRLIVDNIGELVVDDLWLHGQVEALGLLFERPLDIRALDELERRLRDVIDKQRHLKRQLTDAQERLKSMLGGFVDRLVSLSESTSHYHQTLSDCAVRIRGAGDVSELSSVVETLLDETRAVQQTAQRSSAEIGALREQVEAANSLITRLQRELDETSELVRYDPLTGVLNRKGLDEAIAREISRARRHSAVLCVGVLDLDNFKQLNDTFGHRTGDEALRHLADVARGSLRQQDVIGRLGGEEFLVLLPDADVEQAAEIMTRLQRALTKHIFLADNSRILITFSAGIACIGAEETAAEAIDRADKAMYAAKRAGKNRVLVAG
ncbi:GGDEF domain-containing protein [Pseudazoarcus pumilus]|uniref:diguanylate cyclase n=1 Tax=Pseudazoarcus pumilus TaxID=2067960 RepID=A0A2I6S8E3_9RHOO|nr:GGDEF domain-containing protein [Pseudazoarcus pumilus]AUN95512.1 GGDEF domain-containing protein [Pseudazoarcus pumilus]